jgi:hypothetical protein
LAPEREFYFSDILDPYEIVSEETLFTYLSVGEISLLGQVVRLPDDCPNKGETEKILNKRR